MAFYICMNVYIPDRMGNGIVNYIEYGYPPGSFLYAVFCNDFAKAVGSADDENRDNLKAYAAYLYNEAPAGCWGSETDVRQWMKQGGLYGRTETSGTSVERS